MWGSGKRDRGKKIDGNCKCGGGELLFLHSSDLGTSHLSRRVVGTTATPCSLLSVTLLCPLSPEAVWKPAAGYWLLVFLPGSAALPCPCRSIEISRKEFLQYICWFLLLYLQDCSDSVSKEFRLDANVTPRNSSAHTFNHVANYLINHQGFQSCYLIKPSLSFLLKPRGFELLCGFWVFPPLFECLWTTNCTEECLLFCVADYRVPALNTWAGRDCLDSLTLASDVTATWVVWRSAMYMVAYCFLSPKHLEYKILSLDSPHVKKKTKGQEKKVENSVPSNGCMKTHYCR